MRFTPRLALVLVLIALTLPFAVAAEAPVTLVIDSVDAAAHPDTTLVLTVRDEFGVPIPGLTAANFAVKEDLSPHEPMVTAVEPVVNPDISLSVVMVLDVSGSMEGVKLADAQGAARRLLDKLGPTDKVALIAFAGATDLNNVDAAREVAFGGDKTSLYGVVDSLTAAGATPLYDAAFKAIKWAAAQPPGNRAVLLFTDGKEEKTADGTGGSRIANDDSPVREANRAGIPVFTIGLGSDVDEAYLRRLALETGGRYQQAGQSAELAQLFQNVSDLLKQQYRLSYRSGLPADGQSHQLRVDVEVGQNRAFDETGFNTPLIPTPAPVSAPVTPEPTVTPLPEPTATPMPSSTPVPVVASAPPPAAASFFGLSPVTWAGLLGALMLAFLLTVIVRRRRPVAPVPATYRCLRCGHELPAKDAPCPSCGYQGGFKDAA